MRGPHNIWRLLRTGGTFVRTGAMGEVLEALEAPGYVRVIARVISLPFVPFGLKGDPRLPPVVRAFTALGPAYIKFGQTLATRPDVVGPKLADELSYLQDKLPPFDLEEAREVVASELGIDVFDVFEEFSEPVAAASIAQVHHARLRADGREVAVKVLRPRIERAFQTDIDAFHLAARMLELLLPFSRRLRPTDVIEHFESVVRGELDLRLEAASASEFAENTAQDEGFRVPGVLWHLCSRRVLTTDWAEGIAVSDMQALEASGLDLGELGERVLQLFLAHALRDGLFHGDMHQGNLKVAPNGDIIALDFGIMGRIDEYTRRVYAQILYGFIHRDYRRVAEVHFEAGYVPADQDVDAFALALRAIGEPIFGMDAHRVSMARLLAQLFEVTERFGMRTRTELILLQRTMVVVEGVARKLNPDLNMWQTARPVVENYITMSIGPAALARDLRRSAVILSRFGPRIPMMLEEALIRQAEAPGEPLPRRRGTVLVSAALGAGVALAGVWLAALF